MTGYEFDELSVQDILRSWASWMLSGLGTAAMHPLAVLIRDNIEQNQQRLFAPPLADDDALRVDRILASLRQQDWVCYKCVECRYVYRMDFRRLGKQLDISKDKAQRQLRAAERFVSESLYQCALHDQASPHTTDDEELRWRLITVLSYQLFPLKDCA